MKQFILMMGILLAGVSTSTAQEQAAITWDKQTIDLGIVAQNSPAEATFTLTNNSKEAITIKKVKPSCGCTVADYKKTPIAPGETTTIKATYNAKKEGVFTKTVSVYTSLSESPAVLKVSGEVQAENTKQALNTQK